MLRISSRKNSPGNSPRGDAGGRETADIGPIASFFSEHLDSPWSSLEKGTMAAAGLDSLDTVTLRNAFVKKFKTVPLSIFTKPNVTFGQLETSLAALV
jgi:hypothetical protein